MMDQPKEVLNTQALVYTSLRAENANATRPPRDDDEGNDGILLPAENPSEDNGEVCLYLPGSNDLMDYLNADCDTSSVSRENENGTEDAPCDTNSAEQLPVQVESENPKKKKKKKTSELKNKGGRKDFGLRGNYENTVGRFVEMEKEGALEGTAIETTEEDPDYGGSKNKEKKQQQRQSVVSIHEGLNTGSIPTAWIKEFNSLDGVETVNSVQDFSNLFQLESKKSTFMCYF